MQQKLIFRVCMAMVAGLVLPGCGKTIVDYSVKGEFDYVNRTSGKIGVKIQGAMSGATLQEYAIEPSDTLRIYTDGDTHEQYADPASYRPGLSADTTTLIFRDSLCYSEYNHGGPRLHNINSYTNQRRGDRNFVFYFIIDSTLENIATPCN